MDEKLIEWITTEYKIGKWKVAPIDLLLIVFTVVFGILLRSKIWMINGPYDVDVNLLGGMAEPMLSVSIGADILMAALGGIYVFLLTGSKRRGYLTYAILFLSPVTAMGSAMAKSGDGIWLSFLFLALIFRLKNNKVPAIVSALLAAFCSPYVLTKLTFLPGFLSGVSMLIAAYRPEKLLSYHFPNIYQLLGPDAFVAEYEKVGLALTLAAAVALFVWAWGYLKDGRKNAQTKDGTDADQTAFLQNQEVRFVKVLLLFGWILTFICPGMDERAGLFTMALSICFVMAEPKYYYLVIVEMILDFLPGAAFFRGDSFLPLSWAAMTRLLMILYFACKVLFPKEAVHAKEKEQETKQ